MKVGAGGLQSLTIFDMLRAMMQPHPAQAGRPAPVRPEAAPVGTPAAAPVAAGPPGEDLVRAVQTLNRAAEQYNYPYRLRTVPEQPGWVEVLEALNQRPVGLLNPEQAQALVENVRRGQLGVRTDVWA
ncbi:MAG: hypothetical protein ACUVTQ_05315 [Desulfotomaculales bacterium]